MTDTSTETVQALIAEHKRLWSQGAFITASLARQIEQTVAALLDERDALKTQLVDRVNVMNAMSDEWDKLAADRKVCAQQVRDLQDSCIWWQNHSERMLTRAERAEAERDEYQQLYGDMADDERRAREGVKRLTAKLDAVREWVADNGHTFTVPADRELRAILADTDEPKAGWVCSKCAREVTRGYDDGQIPEHHRTCPKRDEPKEQSNG